MQNFENTTLDLVGCPEWGAPAEIVDRFALPSTDGPIEHVTMQCVQRHWFRMAAESFQVARIGERPDRWTAVTRRTRP